MALSTTGTKGIGRKTGKILRTAYTIPATSMPHNAEDSIFNDFTLKCPFSSYHFDTVLLIPTGLLAEQAIFNGGSHNA